MSNTCEHCGAQLTRAKAPFCPTCRRPLRKSGGKLGQAGDSPQLIIQAPDQRAQRVKLVKPFVTIGRASTNDLVIKHPAVSRQHAQLEQKSNGYWITDLGSTNGISINGQRIQSRFLSNGDVIQIIDQQNNSIEIIFNREAASRFHAGAISLSQLKLESLPVFTIGRDSGNKLHLDHPTVSRCHARLERTTYGYLVQDLKSSNGTFINGQPVFGSCPLYLNDVVQIGPFKLIYGQTGFAQYAAIGNYRLDAVGLTYEVPSSLSRGLSHKFILKNIDLSIYPREFVALVGGSGAGKSTLINALSGFTPAKKGRVFLNGDDLYTNFAAYRSVLGYVPQDDTIHSQLTVRSALTYAAHLRLPDANLAEIKQRIHQVLEEVEMLGHETKQVKRLSGGQRKRVSIAVELLADPGLFFLDEPTSGLDPGLEKRLMHIMRRLADDGRTIVLSTHTTASLTQCTHTAFMADGYLVYFGPPQNMLSFFDAVDHADIYDRLSRPVDFALGPSSGQSGGQQSQATGLGPPHSAAESWAKHFQASRQYQQYVSGRIQAAKSISSTAAFSPQSLPRLASGLWQFWILTQRYLDLISRDAISLFVLLAVMPIIGLLLWSTAEQYDFVGRSPEVIEAQIQNEIEKQKEEAEQNKQNNSTAYNSENKQFQATYLIVDQTQKLLFIMALAASLLGIFAAAYEIIKEEAIYRRERMLNLKVTPYLLSKIAVLTLFALLQCFLFLLVIRIRVLYPVQGVFMPAAIEMYVTLFLATLANICLGLFISAVARSSGVVVYIILIVLFCQIIFAGTIFNLPAPLKPLSYFTTTRWTLEALGSSIDMEALKEKESACIEFEEYWKRTALEIVEDAAPPCREGQVKQEIEYEFNVLYEPSVSHLLIRWLILIEFAMILGGLTYITQKRKDLI